MDAIMVQHDVLDTAKLEGLAEGRAEGLAEGRAEGRAEGEKLNTLKTARKLKELGSTVDFISQVTGLTAEEINAL
jgi:predicted transposase/invertase (TIGR01784 family)